MKTLNIYTKGNDSYHINIDQICSISKSDGGTKVIMSNAIEYIVDENVNELLERLKNCKSL